MEKRHTLGRITLLGASDERLRSGLAGDSDRGSSGLGNHDWLIREGFKHVGAHFGQVASQLDVTEALSDELNSITKQTRSSHSTRSKRATMIPAMCGYKRLYTSTTNNSPVFNTRKGQNEPELSQKQRKLGVFVCGSTDQRGLPVFACWWQNMSPKPQMSFFQCFFDRHLPNKRDSAMILLSQVQSLPSVAVTSE